MSSPSSVAPAPVAFEGVCPILRVSNVSASIQYYVDVLGFKVDWQQPGLFACVSRGKCRIFLSQGDQGHPGSWVWIGVEAADALFAEYQRTNAKVRHPPTNYAWAREMQVEDLDGNILRLGSDVPKDAPMGEWLDMEGRRWLPRPEGWKLAD
jgi:catechol 2,3-dioxygenase-like lactoylglutathione lyase family enzyme